MDKKIYRAVDANISRALEGLRVCEDILRFVVNSRKSSDLKEFRHVIAEFSRKIPARFLLNERNVEADSQKFIDTRGEKERRSISGLFSANIGRAIEAVRSLEEFSKMIDDESSVALQQLRFRLYDFEKDMTLQSEKHEKTGRFSGSIYAILDSEFVKPGGYMEMAERLVRGGASLIQLRMKGAAAGEFLETASELSAYLRESGVVFIVNDRPDIAYLSGAGGVHLGQDDIPIKEARKILSGDIIIGVSTHSYEEAVKAASDGPDYIALGPIFDTKSKYGSLMKGIGTDALGRLSRELSIPLVAIGGIDSGNIKEIAESGCRCCAVISHLYKNNRIEDNCMELLRVIG